jgi:hypothetical protein
MIVSEPAGGQTSTSTDEIVNRFAAHHCLAAASSAENTARQAKLPDEWFTILHSEQRRRNDHISQAFSIFSMQ